MGQVKNFMIDVAGIVGLHPNESRAEALYRKIMPGLKDIPRPLDASNPAFVKHVETCFATMPKPRWFKAHVKPGTWPATYMMVKGVEHKLQPKELISAREYESGAKWAAFLVDQVKELSETDTLYFLDRI